MRQKNITPSTNPFPDSMYCSVINLLSRLEQYSPTIYIRSANKGYTLIRKLISARSILSVVTVLNKKQTSLLQLKNT